MSFSKRLSKSLIILNTLFIPSVLASQEDTKNVQDMSDPLAVYRQVGGGLTDKGINLKLGEVFDTGNEATMGMNIIEIKGIGGASLGFRDNNESLYTNVDDSIDTMRFRRFNVDLTSGRGSQLDVNLNFDRDSADGSYSIIQALPKWKSVQLYPLGGLGFSIQNDSKEGITVPGTFAVLGFYGKLALTDKIWINYNPVWLTTLVGSREYKETYFAKDNNLITHEAAISYQITPRANVRYFANWNQKVDVLDGDHRIEFNYQL
ncbi:hypothetical protein DBZ36_08360 [Alginatibacterium sediminis]|uniref:Porin n=2 Tax=Alginatibacterium sediminis TaxID=2164068 RepID=A0A420EIH7_9ALTE|nr:hypothetical protein DBZ36_08360 [Alginatibacterium sediminis]